MLLLTICSCGFMLTENHEKRLMDPANTDLQIMEYIFIFCMTIELIFKACAHGLIFTPEAILASPGGVIDLLLRVLNYRNTSNCDVHNYIYSTWCLNVTLDAKKS